MGYHITVNGAFQMTPPADEGQRARIIAIDQPWRISPNRRLLYLPEEEQPDPFLALRYLVETLLPQLGLSVEGQLTWHGEDGAVGRIAVLGGQVEITEPEPERLSAQEVARLVGQLSAPVEAQRIEAVEVLEFFRVSSERVVQAIAGVLGDPSLAVRMRAANALAAFEAASLPALEALQRALTDPEPWMQCAAAEAIGAIGPGAISALPTLRALQQHPSYGPSGRATEAIARITSGA